MNPAARTREHKQTWPELYCHERTCLWRVKHNGRPDTPCPRHKQHDHAADEDCVTCRADGHVPPGEELPPGEAFVGRMSAACEAAYVRLLSLGPYTGRHTWEGQQELIALRDAIAEATGRSIEDVQNDCESRGLLLALKGRP